MILTKETPDGEYKAEIKSDSEGFTVEYYKPDGSLFKSETVTGRSLVQVRESVETWINGIKTLNG